MREIRWRLERHMTRQARTSWCSWILRHPLMPEPLWWTWSAGWRRLCLSPLRWGEASARWRISVRSSGRERTRSPSTPPPSRLRSSSARRRTSSGASAWWWRLTPRGVLTGQGGTSIKTAAGSTWGSTPWSGRRRWRNWEPGRSFSPAWTATALRRATTWS